MASPEKRPAINGFDIFYQLLVWKLLIFCVARDLRRHDAYVMSL